jgi:hypothetical protein
MTKAAGTAYLTQQNPNDTVRCVNTFSLLA